VPGYDISEYLRELNAAYIHVWEEVAKLKNQYFTNITTVTVATAQTAYDLMFNADNALSAAVSPRLYQITRIRVLPPSGGQLLSTTAMQPNAPDFVALAANPTAQASQTGPYYWYMTGKNQVVWALPLALGTKLEVTYTSWPIALVILSAGTVSSSGATVTGNGTNFTNLCQPDFQQFLPTVQGQEEMQAELVCNGGSELGGQVYRVAKVTSDTVLTTATPIAPALPASSLYALATLPEIPREHIRLIAAVAMPKIYGWVGDDARSSEATAFANMNMQMCKDSLVERQGQNPPTKIRFPGSLAGRRNRYFIR
jgi:hypothetical protein